MSLDHVYALAWRRRLERLLRLNLPIVPSLILLSMATGLIARTSLIPMVELFSEAAYLSRIQTAYKFATLAAVVPALLAFILLPKLGGGMNEAAGAMPIGRAVWARVTTKYFYLSVLPIIVGIIAAFAEVGYSVLHLGLKAVAFLALYMTLVGGGVLYGAFYTNQYMLVSTRKQIVQSLRFGFLVLAAGVTYGLFSRTEIVLEHDQFLVSSNTVLLWIGCLGVFAGAGSVLRRHINAMDVWPLGFIEQHKHAASKRTNGWLSRQSSNIGVVLLVSVMRDAHAWSIYGISLGASAVFIAIAKYLDRPHFSELVIGALPILLITGCMSVVASLRAGLGISRNAIYAFPISNKKVTVSILLVSWLLVVATVLFCMFGANKMLLVDLRWVDVARLTLLATLAAAMSCLTSIAFFETKKDMARGLMSSVAIFIAASPLLMLDGWLRTKDLWQYAVLAGSALGLIVIVLFYLEQQLTRSEYA